VVEGMAVRLYYELKKAKVPAATINFMALDTDVAAGYVERFSKIKVALPGMARDGQIQGHVMVILAVGDEGHVAIQQADTDALEVQPDKIREVVARAIEAAFTNLRIDPPRSRTGQAARLESWRLNYKVAFFQGTMLLVRQ